MSGYRMPWLLALLALPLAFALDIPRKSPDFTISMTDGKQLLLSQYKGKALVLAFILTTCPHCQKAVGYLSQDQNEFAPQGLQVLASAVDQGADRNLPAFMRQYHPSFPVGFNSDGDKVLNYLQHPPALTPHMPILVFIDKDGIIRAQYEGDSPFLSEDQMGQNLHKQIQDLLKPPAPASKKAAPKKKESGDRSQESEFLPPAF